MFDIKVFIDTDRGCEDNKAHTEGRERKGQDAGICDKSVSHDGKADGMNSLWIRAKNTPIS